MEPRSPPPPPGEIVGHILHHVLPLLLLSSLSATALPSRWRQLHPHLSRLRSLLSDNLHLLTLDQNPIPNPLLLHLLPNLLSSLRSLLSLSSRCSLPSALSSGKLLLQSDLHIASSAFLSHLRDLEILLNSGLLLSSSHRRVDDDAAALVLPLPGPTASRADVALFVRDAFARIQIGTPELKQNALDSLRRLLCDDPSKISSIITADGDVSALVRLLDPANLSPIRDLAAAVVSVLCAASDASRRAVFEEGGLGPLLRLLDAGSAAVREHAAAAIEAITADPGNAWAISAYGGVGILVAACGQGGGASPSVRALAAGSLKNVSAVEDLRAAMVEENAVPVLIDLLVSGSDSAQKNAAICLWALASECNDQVRALIFGEGGLQSLIQLICESSNAEVLEHGLRAVQALACYIPAARAASCSHELFVKLSELIRISNVAVQQIAASLVCSLSPSDEIKRLMAECMPSFIKMLESPKPSSAQEVAAEALVDLLAVRSNRMELGRDAKSMTKLIWMLDPKREEICKRFPVSVVIALAASGGCRKRLNELGACQQLQLLIESGMEVAGSKKALKMIAGNRLKNLFSLSWRQ